jgi:hypothetical protein
MRSTQLPLKEYASDKTANPYYLPLYDSVLEPWLEKEIVLLELGIDRGGSLLLWRDYFPRATIVGIDLNLPPDFRPGERIHMYKGNQADPEFLSHVANETAPDGLDIVIDDASHLGELTRIAFWHLFDNHLKPGGLYVIEDWGTGYWDDWPDGKSLDLESYDRPCQARSPFWARIAGKNNVKTPMPCHSYGMVGFVKQLVDEQAAPDVTKRLLRNKRKRLSKFESVTITPSLVFVRKASHRQ